MKKFIFPHFFQKIECNQIPYFAYIKTAYWIFICTYLENCLYICTTSCENWRSVSYFNKKIMASQNRELDFNKNDILANIGICSTPVRAILYLLLLLSLGWMAISHIWLLSPVPQLFFSLSHFFSLLDIINIISKLFFFFSFLF